ncbi:hypothetical protein CDO73_03620 [Saccharibacillus sp. O23]|uniref:hypothetical protein n=1 Tax=Saccharibacillus sp. O23 TaxID=2009338 RepID=UPI000B4E314A|nr:hypothetical protein [Saccharibacillus sp. O23]OWR32700.1 hypothetical protein CDO73_03620 [Saccharibacillus sp. O23]
MKNKNPLFSAACLFALLMILALIGCGKVSQPPALTAENMDGEQMTMVGGSYAWQGVESDSPAPPELIRQETVYDFSPEGEVKLIFDGDEPARVEARLIDMENPQGAGIAAAFDGTKLKLTKEPGYYALNVLAVWKNEDYANYALSVKIGEP